MNQSPVADPVLDVDSDAAWAAQLAATADFSHARLSERFAGLLEVFARRPDSSIPQAFADRHQAKAAYRFFDNQRVTLERLKAPLATTTAYACIGQSVVYCVQDSTSLNYTNLTTTTGLGPINDSERARGLHLHTTLGLDARGVVRGVLDLQIWTRPAEEHTASQRRQRAIDAKESRKWLEGLAAARRPFAAVPLGQRPRLVHIMDAEGDIHEVLADIVAHGDGAIIRSAQNRNIAGKYHHVYEAVRHSPLLGHHVVELAARDGKAARRAAVEVRAREVTLTSSKSHPQREPVTLTVVEAYEPQPPSDGEALCWHLWVTDPVTTLAEAVTPLQLYRLRWLVEDYHHTLKSGCRVEKLELETATRLSHALVLYAAVAARLVGLRDLARRDPEGPCTAMLSTEEWQVLARRCGAPTTSRLRPPTLRQAVLWIGRLGGHQGGKRARLPGVKTLWRGWRDLQLLVAGYRLRT